jgi:hypothetical protein
MVEKSSKKRRKNPAFGQQSAHWRNRRRAGKALRERGRIAPVKLIDAGFDDIDLDDVFRTLDIDSGSGSEPE